MPGKPYASLAERLLANSEVSTHFADSYNGVQCRLWSGGRNSHGYGQLCVRREKDGKPRQVLAHKAAMQEFKGVTLTGRNVWRHQCHNRLCIEPSHLVGGTPEDNMRDMLEAGRHRGPFYPENDPRHVCSAMCACMADVEDFYAPSELPEVRIPAHRDETELVERAGDDRAIP